MRTAISCVHIDIFAPFFTYRPILMSVTRLCCQKNATYSLIDMSHRTTFATSNLTAAPARAHFCDQEHVYMCTHSSHWKTASRLGKYRLVVDPRNNSELPIRHFPSLISLSRTVNIFSNFTRIHNKKCAIF